MPFYFYPQGQSIVWFEDGVLKFVDYLVDAHELERNKSDYGKSAYYRAEYVWNNFHRYSNDTMANLMFDTRLNKCEYDRMNSVMDNQSMKFYISTTMTHFISFAWLSYLLRFRSINKI